ncbi:MAG: ABC transporter permease, partial [Gemmatimonadota bacterium]|nr:ABC transporter permease [Gemmatimonadota bacterium]
MSRLERGFRLVYRGGLWLLPDPIRRRYGNEMLDLFEEELAERRGLERILFVVRSFAGLGATAVLQRIPRRPGEPAGGFWWTRGLGLDLRLAARRMVRRPGLAAAIVATLVLGIGLNTAVFSLVNGLLLRPLPYGDPGRLVQLSETAPDLESMDVSLPDFHYWRTTTAVFSGMFAFDDHTFLLSTPDRPEILEGAVVSPGFMGVLGVSPALGREFLGEEERPGRNRV